MSDNGSREKALSRDTCRYLGRKHIRIKPCTPQTSGKAERFIQTALHEWASPSPILLHSIAPPYRLAALLQLALIA
jgi:hypothetical protein